MTLNNLATIFGPNLLRPGGNSAEINIAAMDVVTPVSVVLYFLNCPEEYFDESLFKSSPESTGTTEKPPKGGGAGAMGGAMEGNWRRESSGSVRKYQRGFDEEDFGPGMGKRNRRGSRRNTPPVAFGKTSSAGNIRRSSGGSAKSVSSARESVI